VGASRDDEQVFSAGDVTVRTWDLANGTELHKVTIDAQALEPSKAFPQGRHLGAIAVTPDGRQAACALPDGPLAIWNLDDGVQRYSRSRSGWPWAIAFSPDGRHLATGTGDNTVQIIDLSTGAVLATLRGHTKWVAAMAFSKDGQRIVTGADDATVRIWDARTGESLRVLTGHADRVWAVAVSPDGRRMVSGADRCLRISELDTGEAIATFTADAEIFSCAISPDARTVVAGDKAGRVHFLRLEEPDAEPQA
jgi:WD40 repeat protein